MDRVSIAIFSTVFTLLFSSAQAELNNVPNADEQWRYSKKEICLKTRSRQIDYLRDSARKKGEDINNIEIMLFDKAREVDKSPSWRALCSNFRPNGSLAVESQENESVTSSTIATALSPEVLVKFLKIAGLKATLVASFDDILAREACKYHENNSSRFYMNVNSDRVSGLRSADDAYLTNITYSNVYGSVYCFDELKLNKLVLDEGNVSEISLHGGGFDAVTFIRTMFSLDYKFDWKPLASEFRASVEIQQESQKIGEFLLEGNVVGYDALGAQTRGPDPQSMMNVGVKSLRFDFKDNGFIDMMFDTSARKANSTKRALQIEALKSIDTARAQLSMLEVYLSVDNLDKINKLLDNIKSMITDGGKLSLGLRPDKPLRAIDILSLDQRTAGLDAESSKQMLNAFVESIGISIEYEK